MWPFLFIIALVPLFFYWSDSITELFPQLAHYFPDKDSKKTIQLANGLNPDGTPNGLEPGKWFSAGNEEGYVSWTISEDGTYRLAVGCHTGSQATLQLTTVEGAEVHEPLTINYEYGLAQLDAGTYSGNDLVSAVSQFANVYLQNPESTVVGKFEVSMADSNAVARAIQQQCAN